MNKSVLRKSPQIGDSIGWYMASRYHDYAEYRGKEFENVLEQSQEEIIGELKTAIQHFGREKALTYLIVNSLASEMIAGDRFLRWDHVLLPAQLFRYCLGFISLIEKDDKDPSSHYLDIVHPLQKISLKPRDIDHSTKNDLKEQDTPFGSSAFDISFSAQTRELTVSRIAFDGQFIDGMRRGYTPFQYEFLEYLGMDMVKSVDYSAKIVELIGRRHMEIAHLIRQHEVDCLQTLGEYTNRAESDNISISDFKKLGIYKELKNAERISRDNLYEKANKRLWISKEELQSFINPKYEHKFEAYLDRMSINLGEGNINSPFDINPIDKSPLLQKNGRFLLPPPMFFAYALSKTFIYDLRELSRNVKGFNPSNRWGDHVEHWSRDIIQSVFDEYPIHRSVDYKVDKKKERQIS